MFIIKKWLKKILFLLFISVTFGGFFVDPECDAETEYISRGRFQFTCLYTESELATLYFFSKRCHCKGNLYLLENGFVDAFNCMLACREIQPKYGNTIDCFCDTATTTMYNHISCAWNAVVPDGKYTQCKSQDFYKDLEPPSCRLIYDKDVDGADLDNKPGQVGDCCSFCKCTNGCKGFSWTDYLNGTCWLKSKSEPLRDGVQVTFGVLDGYEAPCVGPTSNPQSIFNQPLDILINFLVLFVIVTNILGVLLEALVVIFLFKQFSIKDKKFLTTYFIILNYGYFMDLVMFSPFWIFKKFCHDDNFMTRMFNVVEWYAYLWYSCWNMVLALNRATAILLPFNYTQIWNYQRTTIVIILVTILPLIINIESYKDFWDLLHGNATKYDSYKNSLLVRCVITSIFSGILVILSTILSVFFTKSTVAIPKSLQHVERRLIIQSIVSSMLLFSQYAFYYLAIYLPTIPNGVVDWHNRWALFTAGDAFYMFQHFASIGIILIVSPPFRICFIRFISGNILELEYHNNHRIAIK